MAETRTFYSKSRGLVICANHGQGTQVDGQYKRIGEKHINFIEMGDYGMYRTDDPELIEFLDKRMAAAKEKGVPSDVFGPEEYQKLIVPAEMRASTLESENARLERKLQDANRLIADLKNNARK